MKLIIPFTLPGLNEYIDAERKNRYKGAGMKKEWQKLVATAIRRQIRRKLREPVIMHYTWYEKDRRRDKDNISSFGRKVIQDALVKDLHALENDGWSNIESFSDRFHVDKLNPRIEIEILEALPCEQSYAPNAERFWRSPARLSIRNTALIVGKW